MDHHFPLRISHGQQPVPGTLKTQHREVAVKPSTAAAAVGALFNPPYLVSLHLRIHLHHQGAVRMRTRDPAVMFHVSRHKHPFFIHI